MKPDRYQNDTSIGSKMKLSLVSKRYPNNTNLNITNTTTTNKDVVVAFKKLKEEGEEKMQAMRERMVELDFKEEFIEKILKEHSTKKIDEKLDLLLIKRNIKSPTGWLSAALKNDYQDEEEERYDEEPVGQESRRSTENKKILSKEEALQQIQLAKDRLAAITPSYQIKGRW